MRISDWSSDVCSSDLPGVDLSALQRAIAAGMLQQDRLDIVLGQPRLAQRAQQEDVRVGAAWGRAFLVLGLLDAGEPADGAMVRGLISDLNASVIPSANGNHWEDKAIYGSLETNVSMKTEEH